MLKRRSVPRGWRKPSPDLRAEQARGKKGLSSNSLSLSFVIFSLKKWGLKLFVSSQESKILKFLGFMWNPLSWVMEMAALMAIVLANGDGRPPDWQDFVGIVVLLVINSTISFIEENNAGNAAAALMAGLAPKTKVQLFPSSPLYPSFPPLSKWFFFSLSRFFEMEDGASKTLQFSYQGILSASS